MKYREKKFRVPIYHNRVVLIETNDGGKIEKKYGLETEYHLYAHTWDWKISIKGIDYACIFIVFNTASKEDKVDEGIIAHEAFHASSIIMDRKGVKADYENDEAQAYLIEYLVREIHKFI